ncbi:MAG: type II secretion system F family protein [Candidatus Diapherotrites archaeon]|nr:type II secretion system F family protein [Candidatus Diapherotrites archaeon]
MEDIELDPMLVKVAAGSVLSAIVVGLVLHFVLEVTTSISLPAVAIITMVPPFVYTYAQQRKLRQYELAFPTFLSNVHSMLEAQLTLPQAIEVARDAGYGRLDPLVARMQSRMEMGVTFPEAFKLFAKETGSKSIASAVSILFSAYTAGGGRLTMIFKATGDNLRKAQALRMNRESQMKAMVLTGYIVFFMFLAVVIILNSSIFAMSGMGVTDNATAMEDNPFAQDNAFMGVGGQIDYTPNIFYLFLVQAFFSGLLLGEISEGSLVAGLKHITILTVITFVVSVIFLF